MGPEEAARLPEMKTVGEIQIPLESYPSILAGDSLRAATEVIEGAHLEVGRRRSLPRVLLVFDDAGDLVGMVRRRDIMRGLEPTFLVSRPLEYRAKLFDVAVDPNLSQFSFHRLVKGLRDQAGRPVRDVMRPVPPSLQPDDLLMKAVYQMVDLNESLLPVERDGEVLGVVRSVDLFHELGLLIR